MKDRPIPARKEAWGALSELCARDGSRVMKAEREAEVERRNVRFIGEPCQVFDSPMLPISDVFKSP